MDKELVCQTCVDEPYGHALRYAAAASGTEQGCRLLQETVGNEPTVLGSQYDIEDKILETEGSHTAKKQCGNHPYEYVAQFIEMIPKTLAFAHFFSSVVSDASSLPFMPSLKLRTPLPSPFISSGIFLPPKSSSTTSAMTTIS